MERHWIEFTSNFLRLDFMKENVDSLYERGILSETYTKNKIQQIIQAIVPGSWLMAVMIWARQCGHVHETGASPKETAITGWATDWAAMIVVVWFAWYPCCAGG